MKAADFFTPDTQAELVKAIKEAEAKTSGEIRLFIEDHCKDEVLDRAAFMFEKLKMHETGLRNGVLFYLAYLDRKFAIIGDAGINAKVGDDFWNKIKEEMAARFVKGEFIGGLSGGLLQAGEALGKHFPREHNDKNELSDHVELG